MNLLDFSMMCEESYKGGRGWIEVDDLAYAIIPHEGKKVLCCRGSANFRNWMRDFFVVPKCSFDGFIIHGGVSDGASKIIRSMSPHWVKIDYVTGHSLGGGIARELARFFHATSVTFGALKTDFRFGAMPVNRHFRCICDDDPVPMVPGAFYVQDRPADLVMTDGGLPVDPADHFITHYSQRIAGLKAIPEFMGAS